MYRSFFNRVRWGLALAISILLIGALPRYQGSIARAQSVPQSGIVCTTGSGSTPTFTLTADDGYIGIPDGNTVYMWSYALGGGAFQHPGPVLCVNEGDTVTVILHNNLKRDTSIIFPGQSDVKANGAPAQPQFSSGSLKSLTNMAAANGGSVTYSFVAAQPGTYLYESGTEPSLQVQMGLFGALIVRPAGHSDWAYNRADTQFNPSNEYMMLLSEIDPIMHQAVERSIANNSAITFNMVNYHPRYWLINGRGFPDTIAPNGASWLPEQPYGALAHIRPYDPSANPRPALVRYLNAGSEDYPFHPHGNHSWVIGRDGQAYEGPALESLSREEFSISVGPGQTWDATFAWADVENWDATNNPIEQVVDIPRDQNLTFGPYYGSPYLGSQEPKPIGSDNQNQCGEYYHLAHNHNLVQIAGWGITAIGQATYTRIDPLSGCP